MTTLEFHLTPAAFSRFVGNAESRIQPTINVNNEVQPSIGHHALLHEYQNATFTGRWIRCRIVDVTPGKTRLTLALQLLARNSATPVRRATAA
jgi:hypothetical protein